MNIIINIKKVLLITAIPFICAASCNKNNTKPCAKSAYSFTVTSQWSAQKETYNVGDTIFLISTFSKNLLDLISNTNVDYSNSLGIGGNITTSLMDTSTHLIKDAAFNSFTIIPFVGNASFIANNPAKGVNINFAESNSLYEIRIAVILKQKGLFQLAITNLSSQGIKGNNCTNAGFDMTVTNTNKNLNLFQYAIGYMPDALLQKSIYCFRVQ